MARPSTAWIVAATVLAASLVPGCADGPVPGVLRLGFFPNLTHAQALYGVGTGLYQDHLGNTTLQTQTYNAGPTAFESLLAGRVDVIYVGPSPTITAIDRRGLEAITIVAGSASGGAAFVTRAGISSPEDLRGATLASPQLGNTQDIALKHYLREHGLERKDEGGDVEVINPGNPDILTLFLLGRVDGAWVPEPWVTRLVLEGKGQVFVDEADTWPGGRFVTTHVVTTDVFMRERGHDLRALLAAHAEATRRLQDAGPGELAAINDGLHKVTGKRLPADTLATAFGNIVFTDDPLPETLARQFDMAHGLGYAGRVPDLAPVYDLAFLPANATVAPGAA